jgi:hypothetical protein
MEGVASKYANAGEIHLKTSSQTWGEDRLRNTALIGSTMTGIMSLETVGGPLTTYKMLIVILALLSAEPANGKCFKIWHYNKPQRCFTALAPRRQEAGFFRKEAGLVHEAQKANPPNHEQNEIPELPLSFEPAPDGDDYMRGIAQLRALMDAN